MSFQSASGLFNDRAKSIDDADIQHYIENFLRTRMKTDSLYCSVSGMGRLVRIRTSDPVIAEQVLLVQFDVRKALYEELDCEMQEFRVMLAS